ncbi:MAG: ABC transporter substrate-binding protein [Firmicutes bacterium]|nr:ABC transporter substrate-binding protein [Bacillota bacterium]
MISHRRLVTCLVLLIMVSLVGVATAATPTEVRIGVYEPMTGAMAAGGQMTWEGIELAQKQRPNVLGLPVRLILVDNRSDKVEAATAVTRLVQKDKVHAIIGSYGSALSMSGGPVAQQAKVPVMGCSPTNPLVTIGNDYYFRACFIDPFQGRVMAQFAFEKLGAKTAAIIQDVAQDYSVGLANFFREAFIELTGDPKAIVGFTSYQTGDRDFTAQLTYVANAKPDVVFAPGYYADAAVLVTQARSLGLAMPFLGGDTFEAPEFIEIGGKDVEGVYFSTHYSADAPITPASEEFVALYKAEFNKAPNTFAALGYDCYMLVLDAIERAGVVDPVAIRDAMAKTKDFMGATGIITLDANGDATKSAVVLQVQNGEFKLVDVVHPR